MSSAPRIFLLPSTSSRTNSLVAPWSFERRSHCRSNAWCAVTSPARVGRTIAPPEKSVASRCLRDATDFSGGAIVLPTRAGDVTAHHAFDRQWLRLSNDHGAASEFVLELVEGRRKIRGADDMVGNYILQQMEPEKRKLRKYAALVGNRRGKDDVESG